MYPDMSTTSEGLKRRLALLALALLVLLFGLVALGIGLAGSISGVG